MKRGLFTVAVLLLLGYGLFEAWRLLEGPQLSILSPVDGSATSSPAILIEGTAKNIAFLTINDKPSYTDETGHFRQLLSVPPGYTVVTVAATDRFGRRASESVSITMLNFCPVESYG
ncbi:hypothetical protein A2943_01445 [Candidatus Adlerbacteria bacterium RIFCSPLOWO2_01_FULL_51_16]|uniref:Carboxypeptidase regulatory-like domain-containing protein n=1 Tax=Candidatus Adlerbacteria bacterium RIFCSPLOWO2_01_FULL_51_16 TaxID=1797243 RepID=A0A1F4XHJ8_9BACT|nr:MAG: hypothetical protein A2943_01445 [Candidatus Adlerbacteria bacterium RIFCSPLOWO2_01_FULL_51_16]